MRTLLALTFLALGATVASANTATFDSFTEGPLGTSFTDGGINFSNLDRYLGTGATEIFVAEQADGTLTGIPGFSANNALGFGGYSPGPGCAFTRFGTLDFSTGTLASSASLEIFAFANDPNGQITLQGLRNGSVAQTSSVVLPSSVVVSQVTLSLSAGIYDSFHLVSSSPTNQGSTFVVMDNFNVTPVPEPSSLLCLAIAPLMVKLRSKRR